jgi:hypothetical protein
MSKWNVTHPTKRVASAILKLVESQQAGESAVLDLGEAGALLTHLRSAVEVALAPKAVDLQTRDRQLLWEALRALQHVKSCGACGEDSWSACASGGQHAERTLGAIELALLLQESVDVGLAASTPAVPASTAEEG